MGVALGGDVMQPQAALAFVVDHGENVFGVGRNGGGLDFAAVGQRVDGEILKRRGGVAIVDAIRGVEGACEDKNRA